MAIHRLMREAAFGPEDVARMVDAYEAALKRLKLADRSDGFTEIIAEKIIEIARSGHATASAISDQAIKELDVHE